MNFINQIAERSYPKGEKMSDTPRPIAAQREDVLSTLEQILEGKAFGEQSRLRELLRYLVREELDDRGDRLKAYTIGMEVFGRSTDFDPRSDSIVRVEVNRLRQSLDHYYAIHGSTASVRIEVPKGTYRPTFLPLLQASDTPQRSLNEHRGGWQLPATFVLGGTLALAVIVIFAWVLPNQTAKQAVDPTPNSITITVTYAEDVRTNQPEYAISKGIVRDLRSALSRNPLFQVIGNEAATSDNKADFRVETDVQTFGGAIQYSIEAIDCRSDALVWSRAYTLDGENSDEHLAIVEHAARELKTRLLGATKDVLETRDPATLSAQQLVLMATWVSGRSSLNDLEWQKERLALARLAVEKDPTYGPAYSVLADKLAYLAAVDATLNTEAVLQEAKQSWQRAMELAPLDANVVFNVALGQWHSGYVDESVRSMERVVQLDPTHALAVFLSKVHPYTCMVAPDDIVTEVRAFDRQLSADDPIRWVTLTWIGLLQMARGEYVLALEAEARAAQIFQSPYTTIRHAALLNLLNEPEAAFDLIESQRDRWPNIDPAHFAFVTLPRQCGNANEPETVFRPYRQLAASMKQFEQ